VIPEVRLIGVPGIGEVTAGDGLADLIAEALDAAGIGLADGDVVVVASKIVSKAEGRVIDLSRLTVSDRARRLAEITGKEEAFVEAVLSESTDVSRAAPNVLVVRHRLGFTSANAGLDRSNFTGPDHTVLALPVDPDASADSLRGGLETVTGRKLAVVIADTHGRPFRRGNVGIAIGLSGLQALVDKRGESDRHGRVLEATFIPTADQLAGAAALVGGEADEGLPVVIVRGAPVIASDTARAGDLVRSAEEDLYRTTLEL
jgi:coenzyme F420-0:L-glutamate ligase / coenzyme F420-1:gamma-L-glutamate ligase